MDDGAQILISDTLQNFQQDTLVKVPKNINMYVKGVGDNRHSIQAFGILQLKFKTYNNNIILIQIIAAYTPSIKDTTIICRDDLIEIGGLKPMNDDAKRLSLCKYLPNYDYLQCHKKEKLTYLELHNGDEKVDKNIDAIDINHFSCNEIFKISEVTVAEFVKNGIPSDSNITNHRLLHMHSNTGHQSFNTIMDTINSKSMDLKIPKNVINAMKTFSCRDCEKSNLGTKRGHERRKNRISSAPWQIISLDVIPVPKDFVITMKTPKINSHKLLTAKYMLLAVDDFTRKSLAIPMDGCDSKNITRAWDEIQKDIQNDKITRKSKLSISPESEDCKIQHIISDCAAYFVGNGTGSLASYLKTSQVTALNYNQAISSSSTQAEEQWKNGVVEAKWKTIKNKIYTLMSQTGYYLWAVAFAYISDMSNLVSHTEYEKVQQSPYTKMYGEKVQLPFACISKFKSELSFSFRSNIDSKWSIWTVEVCPGITNWFLIIYIINFTFGNSSFKSPFCTMAM